MKTIQKPDRSRGQLLSPEKLHRFHWSNPSYLSHSGAVLLFNCVFCLLTHAAALTNDWESSFGPQAGPLIHHFPLTLTPGDRSEVLGPVFGWEKDEDRSQWAMPPLWSYVQGRGKEMAEFDLAYPLLTWDRFGTEYRFQIFQMLSFAGGANENLQKESRTTIFPLFFHQSSYLPSQNYTALLPFYGHIKNRLFRDETFFIMWPMYVQTRKRDVITDNYVVPFFHLRHGDNLKGWQFWPLVGSETKTVSSKLDINGDNEIVPGHIKKFIMWPFYFNDRSGIGTTNEIHEQALLPFYSYYRSPLRDSTTYFWPFGLTITDDRGKHYREWGAPWPFIGFARGEGKTMNRIWPLFSQAHDATYKSSFYLWPLYKYNRIQAEPLDRERTRILFFLYSDLKERDTVKDKTLVRKDLWPFFLYHRDREGLVRLQSLSILEPLIPSNKSIERNYSPIWSILRYQHNPKTGAKSTSILWNLYRSDSKPDAKKISIFFGLFQYQSTPETKPWRLFFIPVGHKNPTNNVGNAESKSAKLRGTSTRAANRSIPGAGGSSRTASRSR